MDPSALISEAIRAFESDITFVVKIAESVAPPPSLEPPRMPPARPSRPRPRCRRPDAQERPREFPVTVRWTTPKPPIPPEPVLAREERLAMCEEKERQREEQRQNNREELAAKTRARYVRKGTPEEQALRDANRARRAAMTPEERVEDTRVTNLERVKARYYRRKAEREAFQKSRGIDGREY